MKTIALLGVAAVVLSSPSLAKSHHHRHHVHSAGSYHRVIGGEPGGSHPQITCGMVRAYVAQVGLVQAKALAQSHGMTATQERQAIRCLDKKV